MPDRCAIYCRVSTDEQAQEGLSLPTQLAACQDYLRLRGKVGPYGLYVDGGISGGTVSKRPAMSQLMEDVRAKRVSLVVATKLDRLWRNVRDAAENLEEIHAAGAGLALLDLALDSSTAAGSMIFHVMGAFAQFEAKQTGERIAAVNARIVLGGRHVGGHTPPLGYLRSPDKQLIPDPETADLVRRIFAAYVADDTTGPGKIARDLTRDGYKTRTGTWYDRTAIQAILRNVVYVGQLRYGHSSTPKHRRWIDDTERVRAQGSHEPLIDADTWMRAQAKLRRRQTTGRNTSPARLYGGLVWCSYCQARLYSTRGGEPARLYYACGTTRKATARECPEARSISVEILDELVTPALVANLERIRAQGVKLRQRPSRAKPVERDREWTKGKLNRLQEVYVLGGLEEADFRAQWAALQADLGRADTEPPPLPLLSSEAVAITLAAIEDDSVPMAERRRFAAACIERIVVSAREVTIHYRAHQYLGWKTEETIRRPLPWERGRGPRGPYKKRAKGEG